MGEEIKILHPELTGDCSKSILSEIKYLNSLKEKISDLMESKLELEREYDKRSKALGSMVGIVFDYVVKEVKPETTVNKTNIVFKNVNGGSKSW